MLVDSQPQPQGPDGQPVFPTVAALVERAAALAKIDHDTSQRLLLQAVALLRSCQPKRVPRTPRREHGALAPWQLSRVTEYVERNLDSTIRASDLATVIRLSTSHFFRSFRRTAGISPARYVSQRRVEHACQALSTTRQSLADIALICGFCDQAHFAKVFRRWTGESPLSWRRSHTMPEG